MALTSSQSKKNQFLLSLGIDISPLEDAAKQAEEVTSGLVSETQKLTELIDAKLKEVFQDMDVVLKQFGTSSKEVFGNFSKFKTAVQDIDKFTAALEKAGLQYEKLKDIQSKFDISEPIDAISKQVQQSAETDVAYKKSFSTEGFSFSKLFTSEAGEEWAKSIGIDPQNTTAVLNRWAEQVTTYIPTIEDKISKTQMKSDIFDLLGGKNEISDSKLQEVLTALPDNIKKVRQIFDTEGKAIGVQVDLMIDKYKSLSIPLKEVTTELGNKTFARGNMSLVDTSDSKGVQDYTKALKNLVDIQQKYKDSVDSGSSKSSIYEYELKSAQELVNEIKSCINNTNLMAKAEEDVYEYAKAVNKEYEARKAQTQDTKNLQEYAKGLQEQLRLEQEVNKLNDEQGKHSQEWITYKNQELEATKQNNEALAKQIKNQEELQKIQQKAQKTRQENTAKQAESKYQNEVKEYLQLIDQSTKLQKELKKLDVAGADVKSIQEARDAYKKVTDAMDSYSDEVKNNEQVLNKQAAAQEEVASSARALDNRLNRTGASFGSVANKIRETLENTLAYTAAFKALGQASDAVHESIQKIRELDTAMTDIQLVTGYTDSQAQELIQTYSEMAKQLGTTTQTVVDG